MLAYFTTGNVWDRRRCLLTTRIRNPKRDRGSAERTKLTTEAAAYGARGHSLETLLEIESFITWILGSMEVYGGVAEHVISEIRDRYLDFWAYRQGRER